MSAHLFAEAGGTAGSHGQSRPSNDHCEPPGDQRREAVPAVGVGPLLSVRVQPSQRSAAALLLQRTCGNRAVQRILEDGASGPSRVPRIQRDTGVPGATPTTLRMRDTLEDLHYSLEQSDRGELWELIAGLRPASPPLAPLLQLPSPPEPKGDARPTLLIFGPLSTDQTLRALTQAPYKPDWLDRMLRPETLEEQANSESKVDVYIAYSNDGTGNIANQGTGSDQGDTAGLRGDAIFNKHGTGLSRIGLTLIGMTTPRPTRPAGAPFGPETTYQTPKGPYSGALTVDVGVTVLRSGGSVVDFVASAGVDSREWGKLIQDFIHEKVSNSPLFPWPSGTKPLVEGGIIWRHTIEDLTKQSFAGLSYTGRLELDAAALTGTRRSEATVGARFVIRTEKVRTSTGDIWVEFSPVGAFARGFVRYNDGREQSLAGAEVGVNSSIMINFGRFGLGLRGEAMSSSDPAFQTAAEAGSHPTAFKASPLVGQGYGMPAGHHGTGQLIFKISF